MHALFIFLFTISEPVYQSRLVTGKWSFQSKKDLEAYTDNLIKRPLNKVNTHAGGRNADKHNGQLHSFDFKDYVIY